jgi:hypothetical protein
MNDLKAQLRDMLIKAILALISEGKQKSRVLRASFLLSFKINHLHDRFWLAHPCAKRDMPIKRIDQHVLSFEE